jgi:hypothetical protein
VSAEYVSTCIASSCADRGLPPVSITLVGPPSSGMRTANHDRLISPFAAATPPSPGNGTLDCFDSLVKIPAQHHQFTRLRLRGVPIRVRVRGALEEPEEDRGGNIRPNWLLGASPAVGEGPRQVASRAGCGWSPSWVMLHGEHCARKEPITESDSRLQGPDVADCFGRVSGPGDAAGELPP